MLEIGGRVLQRVIERGVKVRGRGRGKLRLIEVNAKMSSSKKLICKETLSV